MGLIHVYNGINDKQTIETKGKIKDAIKNVNWEHSIILRNGFITNENYEVKEDDIIFVRKIPAISATAAIVISAVALVTAGVTAGVAMYKQRKALQQIEDAQKAAKAGAETTEKLPFVRGARNVAATGQTFPFIIGESLMTPYRLCPAHYTISGRYGETQYYNVVLEAGYNDLLIKQLKMGETIVKQFNNGSPQNGVYQWDNGVYYDQRNIIEIRQTGDFETEEFNHKIISTEVNQEIPHRWASFDAAENAEIEREWRAGVVQELPRNAMRVETIIMFDGLQMFYNNLWYPENAQILPQWTNVNNPTENDWHNFDAGFNQNGNYSNTFYLNSKKQMRFSAVQNFTPAQSHNKTIKVRLIRKTARMESNAKDACYLLAVQTTCYDAKKSSATELVPAKILEDNERDKCCRIGIRVAANSNTDGMLDAFSVIAAGTAQTWNGEEWSETKTMTRNLASWVRELMTSDKHAPSQYGQDELDAESWGKWYEYCETQGFHADGVINKGTKKKTIIETLCANGNACLVLNPMSGKVEVAIDNGRDYSVALLNSENIIGISTSRELKRKPDGKKVTYVNAAAGYDIDSVVFMRDGEDYDPQTDTLTETALQYVTDYGHAFKIAWRQMAEELAQPRTLSVRVGYEAAYYPIYSCVELQHKSLKIGIDHGIIKALEWHSGILKKIILSGYVTFPESGDCGVIINAINGNGHGVIALKVRGTGRTDTLDVVTILHNDGDNIPETGNNLSFGLLNEDGEFDTVSTTMKVTNAEENDNGYTLTLVDYNPALYEYGTLPEYKSNLTLKPDNSTARIEDKREYVTKGEAEALSSGAAQSAIDTITRGLNFTNVYKLPDIGATLDDIIRKIDDDARNSSASISMSADEILLQVNDMERELVGLIDVQAGAVTALVEGGGAQGQLSLSLELPALISEETRARFLETSTETKVNAVYGKIENSPFYGIKPNASTSAIKQLWDDAVAGNLLASQITMKAEQIVMSTGDEAGEVIIENGKLRAALIDVEKLLAEEVTVKDKGIIKSSNYNGTINEDGTIEQYGSQGWAIDHSGRSDFSNVHVNGTVDARAGHFWAGVGDVKFINRTQYFELNGNPRILFCYISRATIPTPTTNSHIEGDVVGGVYLISGWTHSEVASGKVFITGTGRVTKLYEDSNICTAQVEHIQSSDAFTEYNYYQIKVYFNKEADVLNSEKYTCTELKLGVAPDNWQG